MIDNSTNPVPVADLFVVFEARGFKKRIPWNIRLNETQAEFSCQEDERKIVVSRDTARSQIRFMQTGLMLSESTIATVSGTVNLDFGGNKAKLVKWFPPISGEEIQKDLRGMGIGMMVVGVISILLKNFLDPIWGALLILLGILNLVIKNRIMYIVNGIALIAVGIFNILAIITTSSAFWLLFGFMQIGWGISEIKKFNQARA